MIVRAPAHTAGPPGNSAVRTEPIIRRPCCNFDAETVSVINTVTSTVIDTLTVGDEPARVTLRYSTARR
ncbi:hypothetical protein ACIHAR_02765 [Streptomyces sp. NPDC052016]|uniref:hypothetical protein n=1 Tax=Streptomyces sp. NPDC052016 TaxID=3365680 RepID=UPI0037D7F641